MRTYSAELVPFRMKPLHEKYVARALAHAELLMRPGAIARHAYETTCPYCGVEDALVGVIRLGAKEQVTNVPMTRTGYDVPDTRGRDRDIQIVHCQACAAAIDPLAYLSPANFYAEKENVPIWRDQE